jgi:hypothetical protein
VALAALFLLVACGGTGNNAGGAAEADTGEYVVERSTAEGIETVRTVSGSRWGGAPRLVEELAIGEEVGDDAYLFGAISDAWDTGERIYVVDMQVPVVRAYDERGRFLHQVGGVGQGPGEYNRPVGIAVTEDGRVLVTDLEGARLNVFGPDGEHVDDWGLGSPQAALGLLLADNGDIYTRVIELPDRMGSGPVEIKEGMQQVGSEGHVGEPIYPPDLEWEPPTVQVDVGNNSMQMAILPFTPRVQWDLAPGGQVITGVGNEYRFEIHSPDGGVKMVEKAWEPVRVNPDERGFRAEMAVNNIKQMAPDFRIPESDVPATKPAFIDLTPDRSGRVWVRRQGPSEPDPDCREAEGGAGMAIMIGGTGGTTVRMDPGADPEMDLDCWRNTYMFDVFDVATGEFLGTVPAPEPGFTQIRFADGDTVLASVTDEVGTVRLKKYRLVID